MTAWISAAAMSGDCEEGGDSAGQAPGVEPRPGGGVARAKPRILLVEDDYLVGMELEAGLREAGFETVGIAASAEEAVALAEAGRPQLVVMDIRLAGDRDGVDAAIEIHRRLGIRSLFASAHGDADVRARAEKARPLGWIAKPYRISHLLAAVRRALAQIENEPSPVPRLNP